MEMHHLGQSLTLRGRTLQELMLSGAQITSSIAKEDKLSNGMSSLEGIMNKPASSRN